MENNETVAMAIATLQLAVKRGLMDDVKEPLDYLNGKKKFYKVTKKHIQAAQDMLDMDEEMDDNELWNAANELLEDFKHGNDTLRDFGKDDDEMLREEERRYN